MEERLVNLTRHDVTVRNSVGEIILHIPASGKIAEFRMNSLFIGRFFRCYDNEE